MLGWIDRRIEERLQRFVQEEFEQFRLAERHELVKQIAGSAIAIVSDEVMLGPTKEYTLLDSRTQKYEFVDAAFDLSHMKHGDQIEIDFGIRFGYDEEPVRWERYVATDDQEKPALQLPSLLAPAGATIKVKHLAGRNFLVRFFVLRHY